MRKNLTAMSNYMIQKDIDAQKFFSGERPDTDSIIKCLQPQLQDIAEAVMKAEGEDDQAQYQSVISMVYTLVEDGKLPELFQTIKSAFPEYYNY